MSNYISYILVIISLYGFTAAAQDEQLDWSKHAQESFSEKDYYGAAYYYNKALMSDSVNLDYHWKMALSYAHANEHQKAAKAFTKLIELDVKINYPEAVYHLGNMLKQQERYQEAQVYFEMYKDIATDRSHPFYKQAKNEIKACILAESWQSMSPTITLTHPSTPLNGFDAEYSPVWINDTLLYFSALRYDSLQTKDITLATEVYRAQIYQATLIQNNWEITPLDTLINDTLTDNANPSLDADGNQLYFTRCNAEGCAIWVAKKNNTAWEAPQKLGQNINLEGYSSTHPNVAQIGQKTYLFFASNRARTRGGMDIWSVEIKKGNKYGRPKNAGRKVNTKGNEITPFYSQKNEALHFSSNFHVGFGGFDVYSSNGTPGKFKDPTNKGKPINSSVNDYYYSEFEGTDSIALVSNRPEGYALKGYACCNDLYLGYPIDSTSQDTTPLNEVPVEEDLEVKLQAVQFLPLALYFDNDQPNPRTRKTTTTLTYENTFETYLDRKSTYLKKGISKAEVDTFFSKDVEVGFIKLQMLADSLHKYLAKGYRLQLGIKGFTSPLGDTEYNDKLALRRIASIENYLNQWQGGILKQYVDSGLLQYNQIPFGEYLSQTHNDDRKNVQNSVYGIGASKARKVEIVWVEQTLPTDTNAIIQFENTIHNFGQLPQNGTVKHAFKFTNAGASELIINEVTSSCSCVTINYPQQAIGIGQSAEIEVTLNTRNHAGLQFHGLVIHTNAKKMEKKLFIRGVIPPFTSTTP